MRFWVDPEKVPIVVWIFLFYVFVICINMFGVLGYGEGEYIFSCIKVVAVIGVIILGIVIDLGGSPTGKVYGTEYWRDPGKYPFHSGCDHIGAFNNGFKGICAVFVTAAFSFAGTELAGLAAAETVSPCLRCRN